jgi:pimeloyl-ACP methyl ester carboxylesterase
MHRPRILLVPHFSELDWRIKPLLEEWAQVASFDAPGVGDEPPPDAFTTEAVVERGVAELDRQGWDRCVVVGDELGAPIAVHLAAAVPARLEALALGHACLRFRRQGQRPTISPEVLAGLVQMARTDYRSYARMLTHFSQGAYDDELVDRYIERVPGSVATAYLEVLLEREEGEDLEPALRGLDVPLLLAEHSGCLLFTPEGYEEAVAAFPDAVRASFDIKPAVSPEFAETLRSFCHELPAARTGMA